DRHLLQQIRQIHRAEEHAFGPPLEVQPYDDHGEDHRIGTQRRRRNLHAVCSKAWPVALAMIFSAVASSRRNSPVTRPSCSTRMRSESPSTSGSSDETSTMANPSEARRSICA